MKAYLRWIAPVLFAAVLSGGSRAEEAKPPAAAEPEQPEGRLARLFIEASDWIAEPDGLGYAPATESDPKNAWGTRILHMPVGTESRVRYRAGYLIRGNIGEFILTWYSHVQKGLLARYSPGDFVYGETPVHPLFAGVFDDGTADGFLANTDTRLRDLRLDFYRIGHQSARVTVRWFVGYRRVEHDRSLYGKYYPIFPVYQGTPIPPFPVDATTPNPLAPRVDDAYVVSQFNGGGAEAGAELTFSLNRRLYIETGLSLAVLQGKVRTQSTSMTHFYALMTENTGIDHILSPPFSEFEETDAQGRPLIVSIRQFDVPVSVTSDDTASGQVLETYLGIRWKAWRGLEVFTGFRNARYTGVGADIRPNQVTATYVPSTQTMAVKVADVTRTDRDVTYQGFYLGVSYKF
jgi:hypothetical protein